MEEAAGLLDQPWETMLTLAAGYAGYFVAHVGSRQHHQPVDQIFRVVLYGFFGMLGYVLAMWYVRGGVVVHSLIAIIAAVLVGVFWRLKGRKWLESGLRGGLVSFSDDIPAAWTALSDEGSDVIVAQLKVRLVNGTALFCDDLVKFKKCPNGPCVLGPQGDVLLYVTHSGRPGGSGKMEWSPVAGVLDADFGAMITYVPSSQIARVELRQRWRKGARRSN